MENKKYDEFIKDSYREYSIEVLQNRALSDYRDGLKPVQRKALWTAYKLGLHNNRAFTKSSNVTGNLMARFHAHADAYQVLVNMSQGSLNTPLFEGQGNWGNYIDPPAAARYTEVKLSKYSDDILLNDMYLNVTKMIPNYLDTEVEPLLLPSLLPTLLLIGCQGIAVGYKTEIPCFSLKSVIKLTKLALQRKVSAKDLLKVLEFDDVYNAICVAEDNQLLDYYKSGKGSIPFSVDWDVEEGKKSFIIYSIVGNGETMISKIESDDRVYQVNDLTSGNDIQIQVVLKPSVKLDEVEDIADDIVDNLKVNKIFVTNVIESSVIETKDGGVTFYENTAKLKESNLVDLMNEWIEWRVKLETLMLKDQIRLQEERIKKLEFYRWVISKLDIIFKVLKSKCKDLTEELSKKLKCSNEDARQILDMPVRRLSKLSDEELKTDIKNCKNTIQTLKKYLKKPADKIIEDIAKLKIDNYTQV